MDRGNNRSLICTWQGGGGGEATSHTWCVCFNRTWAKSDFWAGFITFDHFGEGCNAIVLVIVLLTAQRSGLKTQFWLHRIAQIIAKTARGYFEIWRETRVLASSWKFPKSTYIVALLHSSAAIKLSVDWEKHHALQKGLLQFFAVIFFTHQYQDLKRTFPFHWLEIFVCDNFNTKYLNLLFWCHRTAHPFDCFCWSGNTTFR